jgi:hypothetical protein
MRGVIVDELTSVFEAALVSDEAKVLIYHEVKAKREHARRIRERERQGRIDAGEIVVA